MVKSQLDLAVLLVELGCMSKRELNKSAKLIAWIPAASKSHYVVLKMQSPSTHECGLRVSVKALPIRPKLSCDFHLTLSNVLFSELACGVWIRNQGSRLSPLDDNRTIIRYFPMTGVEYSVKSKPTCIKPVAFASGKHPRERRIEGLEIWPDVLNNAGVWVPGGTFVMHREARACDVSSWRDCSREYLRLHCVAALKIKKMNRALIHVGFRHRSQWSATTPYLSGSACACVTDHFTLSIPGLICSLVSGQ